MASHLVPIAAFIIGWVAGVLVDRALSSMPRGGDS